MLKPDTSKNRSVVHLWTILVVAMLSCSAQAEEKKDIAFLENYCVKCHGAEQHQGDVRLDQLALHVAGDNHYLWTEIVHNIQRGEMPPKDAKRPTEDERRAFLAVAIPLLTRYEADSERSRDPLVRLTNNQIAHSLQDLLHTDQHIAHELIADPVDKHGYSRQTELGLSGAYLQLYAKSVARVVTSAIPDPEAPAPAAYRVLGSDWEKRHWASHFAMATGRRRLYEGPQWLGNKFEIPLPPKHEHRMFLRDNRSEGRFRIALTVVNEPPTYGYGEHFLLKSGSAIAKPVPGQEVLENITEARTVRIPNDGIYQVDVFLNPPKHVAVATDA